MSSSTTQHENVNIVFSFPGSVLNLGSGAGCLAGFVPMVLLGQRVTMLLFLPIFLTSWMALSFSSSIWMLQVSRVVMGFTGGVMEVAAYGYATEIAHSNVRGALVGLVDTVRYMGLLLVYVLGCFSLTWRQVALLCGCLTTLPAFVFLAFLPNAPRWLVTKNRDEKARRSLSYFRGLHYDITMEMDTITRQVKDNQENSGMILTQLRQIREPTTLKIVIILAFLMISVQFTGNIVVMSYVVPIFDAAEVDIDSSMSAVVVAMVRIVGTIFSLAVVDHLGRRPAIITSFLFIGMSLALLGVFFLLHSLDTNLSSFSWLPLALLTSFSFFSSVGHPVLNLVRGELLPTTVRSAVAPLLYALFFVAMFLAAQTYPALAGAVGEHGTFWVYAGVSLLVAVVTALFIPETKAVTLENISFTTPFSRCIFRDNKKVQVAVRKSSQTVTFI